MKRASAKENMRERILETADRLFYGQGIRAIGVDTVAAEIGISKRTLYNYFPSKDELIAAYLSRRCKPVPVQDFPPGKQILAFFDHLERRLASVEFRGCPFVNAAAELGEPTHPGHRVAFDFKEGRRRWFRERLALLDVRDPDGLATQLILLVDGASATALVRGDPTVARSAKKAAETLLNAATVIPQAAAKGVQNAHRSRRVSSLPKVHAVGDSSGSE